MNVAQAGLDHQALSVYISTRWNVDVASARKIVAWTEAASIDHGIDPLLVLAVIARESSFQHIGNHFDYRLDVESTEVDPNTPHGYMQIDGTFHPEKMPVNERGQPRVTTGPENIQIGTQILREYLDREKGSEARALQRYNGSLSDTTRRFSNYVLQVRDALKRVQQAA
ncbi:transglycosylase SLT domain-containing protein [Roseateles asaccharophilus]|uniref:transglycosylase SLT domain-containing protein n=1 Tax=Roseateles asaccharophilus TaxID=582607 RepID=UPI00384B639F